MASKKVVLESSIVTIGKVSNLSNVGVQWNNGVKGIPIETREGFVTLNSNTKDISNSIVRASVRDYVEKALNSGDAREVLVFDTYKELLEWYSK